MIHTRTCGGCGRKCLGRLRPGFVLARDGHFRGRLLGACCSQLGALERPVTLAILGRPTPAGAA